MSGGRKNTKKQMKGGSFFKKLFGKKDKEVVVEEGINMNNQVKEYKSIDDFMGLVSRNNVPKEYVDDQQLFTIDDFPTNLSENKYCKNKVLPTELEYDTKGPYGKYFENFNQMRTHYKNYNAKLIAILLGEILINQNNQFKIRQIDSEKLFEIEKKTRQTLLEFYTISQKIYVEAFSSLVDGVESSLAEQKKKQIKEELGKL